MRDRRGFSSPTGSTAESGERLTSNRGRPITDARFRPRAPMENRSNDIYERSLPSADFLRHNVITRRVVHAIHARLRRVGRVLPRKRGRHHVEPPDNEFTSIVRDLTLSCALTRLLAEIFVRPIRYSWKARREPWKWFLSFGRTNDSSGSDRGSAFALQIYGYGIGVIMLVLSKLWKNAYWPHWCRCSCWGNQWKNSEMKLVCFERC